MRDGHSYNSGTDDRSIASRTVGTGRLCQSSQETLNLEAECMPAICNCTQLLRPPVLGSWGSLGQPHPGPQGSNGLLTEGRLSPANVHEVRDGVTSPRTCLDG